MADLLDISGVNLKLCIYYRNRKVILKERAMLPVSRSVIIHILHTRRMVDPRKYYVVWDV